MAENLAAPEAIVPSTRRPLPLRRREDLIIAEIPYRGVPFPVIKDPLALTYHRLQPDQFAVWKLLDGRRSLAEIRDQVQREFPALHFTAGGVQQLIADLHEKGLLIGERPGQGQVLIRRAGEERLKKFRHAALNPLYLRLPGWDPERTLQRLDRWFGWLFHPVILWLGVAFAASALLFVAIRFDDVRQRLPEFQQFFAWPNLLALWATLAGIKVLHEFGHGLACRHYGAECHSIGVMLLVFSPTMYCDVTDAWMLKSKWRRIFIGAAGMYVEVILASAAIYFWYFSQPGLLNHLALNVFFVSTVTTVIFNANPLLRYDGYYMLSDYLEIPNLRPQANKLLSESFGWWALGIEPPLDPFMPTTGRFWFILFAIASSLYSWVVMFGITVFLYTVLKPYRLQSLGVLMAVFSATMMIGGMVWPLGKMLFEPRQDPLSRFKIAMLLVGIASAVTMVLTIPAPWYEEAVCYTQPRGVAHVFNAQPGTLADQRVRPGERVDRGQVLAVLESPQLADRILELEHELAQQSVDPKLYRELRDPESQNLAEQRRASLEEQLRELRRQEAELMVRAPISGVVVASSRTRRPPLERRREQLPQWHETPLAASSRGATFEARTHFASIAPSAEIEAVLLIRQSDRGDLQVGSPVRLQFEVLPGTVIDGVVEEFSDRAIEFAPPLLTSKAKGPLVTVTDSSGRERLSEPMYQATVSLPGAMEDFPVGLRGAARFVVAERTLWNWLWRWFRQTFQFRL